MHRKSLLSRKEHAFANSLIEREQHLQGHQVSSDQGGWPYARGLFLSDRAVLSHDRVLLPNSTSMVNQYNYGNRNALKTFERTYLEQTVMLRG